MLEVDIPVNCATSWLTLRGRVEYLWERKVIPSDVSDTIDVTGWSFGAYIV